MKKILMITTGGTIACSQSGQGLIPTWDTNQYSEMMQALCPDCQVNLLSIMNVDSTNMTPDRMQRIARTIYKYYQDFDGFVVSHGTDTMAYSASLVAYMLHNLSKPVVFTGSQLPLEAEYTDAKENLKTAVHYASFGQAGVWIAFHGKIMNALRCKKLYSKNLDAFHSIPAFSQQRDLEQYESHTKLQIFDVFESNVLLLKLYPGMPLQFLTMEWLSQFRGIIIEGYGVGNVPGGEEKMAAILSEISKQSVAVAISSQCVYDGIAMGTYEVSKELDPEYIIDGGDMTTEALTMKMMWALGNYQNIKEVKEWIEKPYRDDRSERK